MAVKSIWVRMDGWLTGPEEIIEKLVSPGDGDVDFDEDDIKGLIFESENRGYIPSCTIEQYYED